MCTEVLRRDIRAGTLFQETPRRTQPVTFSLSPASVSWASAHQFRAT